MSRNRNQRSKLQRRYKAVLNHFGPKVQIRCFRSVADLERASREMEEIASKTKRRLVGGSGFFNTPQTREEMVAAAERGWLRIYILYLDEKPAAFWRGTVYSGRLQGDHAGYDPAWSKFSPGTFLFLSMIDRLREQNVTVIDLGFGDTQFKQYLGNARRIESRIRIYAPTLRGTLWNLLNLACPVANDCARFLLKCWLSGMGTYHLTRPSCAQAPQKRSRSSRKQPESYILSALSMVECGPISDKK